MTNMTFNFPQVNYIIDNGMLVGKGRLANLPGFPGNVPGFEAVPGLPGLLKKFPVSSFERKVIPVGSFVPIS